MVFRRWVALTMVLFVLMAGFSACLAEETPSDGSGLVGSSDGSGSSDEGDDAAKNWLDKLPFFGSNETEKPDAPDASGETGETSEPGVTAAPDASGETSETDAAVAPDASGAPDESENPDSSAAPDASGESDGSDKPSGMEPGEIAFIAGAVVVVVGIIMVVLRKKSKTSSAPADASVPAPSADRERATSVSPDTSPAPVPVKPAVGGNTGSVTPVAGPEDTLVSAQPSLTPACQIRCLSGAMAGAVFPISGTVLLGRDPAACAIVYPRNAPGVSAKHCSITSQGNGILLMDLGSSYGTMVVEGNNGSMRRLQPNASQFLTSGQVFCVGGRENAYQVL